MNLETYLEIKNKIETRLNAAQEVLNSFQKNSAGMVDWTPSFIEAHNVFEMEYDNLRILNVKAGKDILKAAAKLRRASWKLA